MGRIHEQIKQVLFTELGNRVDSVTDYRVITDIFGRVLRLMAREKKGGKRLVSHLAKGAG